MHNQYNHAKQKALAAAVHVQQVDFVETLDLCLQSAIADEEGGITRARAIEILDSSTHFFGVCKSFLSAI